MHYQISSHGAGRFSVQVFDGDTLTGDENIIRDVNGFRVAGQSHSEPQHKTVEACARHYATLVSLEKGILTDPVRN